MSKKGSSQAARGASAKVASSALLSPALVPPLIVLLALPCIFLLPFHVPMIGPNGSQSWEFGFNNTTAQVSIALMLLAIFAWRQLTDHSDIHNSSVVRAVIGEHEPGSLRTLWLVMASLQIVNLMILLIWYRVLPYTHYGEFTYFMQRLEVMVGGAVPHRDFDFDYGTGLLAAPMFVYNLFRGRLSLEDSYFSVLLVHWAVGYCLLAYLVSRLNVPRYRPLVFLLLAVPFLNLTLGLQYTPLRHTIALASIFGIRHAYLDTVDSPRRRWILMGLGGLLLPFVCFLISPEMGLALTVALLAFLGWFIFGPERRLALLVAPVLASIGIAFLVFPRAYFNSMLSFGKGGASFPIFPTMHVLAFLAVAIWVFPQLGLIAVRDKTAAGPFCAGLAILMGLFILPAMGRCDAGHIFINSIGLLMIALAASTWLAPRWNYSIFGGYTLVFAVMIMAAFWDNYKEPITDALNARSQISQIPGFSQDNYPDTSGSMPAIHFSKLLPQPTFLNDLPDTGIGVPMGVDEATEQFLYLTGRMGSQYHIAPYFDLFDPSTLPREYADIRKFEYILIPQQYVGYLQINEQQRFRMQGDADCKFMSGLLLFPIDMPPVHPTFVPNIFIMRDIANEYGIVKQYPGMLLLRRKTP